MKVIPLLVILLILLSSCATLITGTRDTVSLSTVPEGAKVILKSVDGLYREEKITPAIFTIPSDNTYIVTIEMEGYKTKEIILEKKVSGWVIGNIFLGGIIGLAVDFISGGAYTHDKAISVELEKEKLPEEVIFKFKLDDGNIKEVIIPVVWESIKKSEV